LLERAANLVKGKILAVVEDLIFASKIKGTAEALGLDLTICSKELVGTLELFRRVRPDGAVIDLQNRRLDPVRLIEELKSDGDLKLIKLIAFYPHVETRLKDQAEMAGCDQVITRASFTSKLPQLLDSVFGRT
jgi:CheY-like chemotaxis protein